MRNISYRNHFLWESIPPPSLTGIPSATGHLLSRCRHLSQRIGVRAHVREDDQHVEAALVREVLGCRQRDTRRDDALDGGVVGEVEEQHGPLQRAVLLKVLLEEVRRFHVDSHGGKHNGELVAGGTSLGSMCVACLGGLAALASVNQACLSADLCRDIIVGKTCSEEETAIFQRS